MNECKPLQTGKKFDFILLETTGLADPGPVVGRCRLTL